MRSLSRAVVLASALFLTTTAAEAAPAPVFALKPVGPAPLGYYRFDAGPGQRVEARVRVVNAGRVAGTAELAVVDAVTGATTGAVYRTVGERSSDVGAWLHLAARSVRLAPGASAVVPFTVTVPSGARRGQHLGGIVARPATARRSTAAGTAKHSFRVDVVDQSILAVQVDLPGAARGLLRARGVTAGGNPGYQTLDLQLSNPGERMVKGRGTVIVTDEAGAVVKRQSFAIDTFLPRTRIAYPLVMRGEALLPGDFRAEVRLRWAGGGSFATTLPFSVTRDDIEQAYGAAGVAKLPAARGGKGGTDPKLLLGVGVLLLLAAFAAMGWWFRRRTRELERRLARALPPEPESDIEVRDTRGTPAGRR